jgi:hypothetical protein
MYMCTKCKCRVVCRMVWRPCRSPRLSLRPEGRWEAHALSCAVRMVPFLRREKLPWQPGQASGANSRPQLRGRTLTRSSRARPGTARPAQQDLLHSHELSSAIEAPAIARHVSTVYRSRRCGGVGQGSGGSLSASQRRFGRVTNYVLTWLHRALGMPC